MDKQEKILIIVGCAFIAAGTLGQIYINKQMEKLENLKTKKHSAKKDDNIFIIHETPTTK